jgi:electron transfer flavoprotein alpha subunit
MICGELEEEKITSTSKELITTGKRLSSTLNQPLIFLLIGENLKNKAEEAAYLGIDKVLTVEGPEFSVLHPERLFAITMEVCKHTHPFLILLGQTDMGRDLAPRLAAKLKASACLDCAALEVNQDTQALIQTKPVFGGNALSQWISKNHQPHVVTMRPRAAKPAVADSSKKGTIVPFTVRIDNSQVKSQLVETVKEETKGTRLDDAKIIVAGGGGIGGEDGFRLIHELAYVLGGTVGITRVPADEHWMPASLEIGQTGHIVNPNLYIAVGISGAPQHLAGCAGSKFIVAINKDPQAHIFEEADFGVIGDFREFLPAFIHELKNP